MRTQIITSHQDPTHALLRYLRVKAPARYAAVALMSGHVQEEGLREALEDMAAKDGRCFACREGAWGFFPGRSEDADISG